MNDFEIMIETPMGSREKYNYQPDSKTFLLKKLLPLGMTFPFDFGFLPGTKGEDGDPLDAVVISEFKTFPGCVVRCRLIGVLEARQTENRKTIRNDRYFFIPEHSMAYQHIHSVKQLPNEMVQQLIFFFVAYNKEEGKHFQPMKMQPPLKAAKLLKKQPS